VEKIAVTVVLAVNTVVHVPVPLQPPPLQPEKTEPVFGTALRKTVRFWMTTPEQVVPQLIPPGDDVTVPPPVPVLTIVTTQCSSVNDAPMMTSEVIVLVHVPVPLQPPPLQPPKAEVFAGVAVIVTVVP